MKNGSYEFGEGKRGHPEQQKQHVQRQGGEKEYMPPLGKENVSSRRVETVVPQLLHQGLAWGRCSGNVCGMMEWQALHRRYSLENGLQRPWSGKRLLEHWKWKWLAAAAGVRERGEKDGIEAIKEGESRRLGDRMTVAVPKG